MKNGRRVNYRTMIVLALIAGGLGIAVLFMPDGEILSFMLSCAALGGLIGGSKVVDEVGEDDDPPPPPPPKKP